MKKMVPDPTFEVINKTRVRISRKRFLVLKEAVLGKTYELSFALVGPADSRTLNRSYRGKDKPTNILSFPLGKQAGEIVIAPSVAKKEAPKFERHFSNYLEFLFIHGLVHLKGFDHGSKMERIEQRIRRRFSI